MSIKENLKRISSDIPEYVTVVAAAKQRTPEEVIEIIDAGITDIGENYVQEAEKLHKCLGKKVEKVRWHMIGHLQTNKINKALRIFDVIQTVDSLEMAQAIDKRVELADKKVIPVYIEINIGSEISKSGVNSDYKIIEKLARSISELGHLRLEGLMTLGPITGNPEHIRPYFREVKGFFEKIEALNLPGVEMKTLSMGMTNSYKVAIEEGSNMVRIGTAIFGPRKYKL